MSYGTVPGDHSDGLLTLGNNGPAMIMGRMGREMVVAHTITNVTVHLSMLFNMGLGQHQQRHDGANTVGRGDYDDAMQQGVTFLAL